MNQRQINWTFSVGRSVVDGQRTAPGPTVNRAKFNGKHVKWLPMRASARVTRFVAVAVLAAALAPARAAELTQTIERIKPSIVGIGTFLKVRSPSIQFVGTGFVVADGRHVVTNAHAVTR